MKQTRDLMDDSQTCYPLYKTGGHNVAYKINIINFQYCKVYKFYKINLSSIWIKWIQFQNNIRILEFTSDQ